MKWNIPAALKILKYTGIGLGLKLALMAFFPVFLKDKVNNKVREYISSQVTSEFSFNEINLNFSGNFPI